MQTNVKLFGPVARIVGRDEMSIALDDENATCGELRRNLLQAEPKLATPARQGRFAVNYEYVGDEHVIADDDEIALIAMISGG